MHDSLFPFPGSSYVIAITMILIIGFAGQLMMRFVKRNYRDNESRSLVLKYILRCTTVYSVILIAGSQGVYYGHGDLICVACFTGGLGLILFALSLIVVLRFSMVPVTNEKRAS